jgi:hypothetical protein
MQSLEALLQIPDPQRDEIWEDHFLTRLTEAKLNLLSEDPQMGPDNWPYLMAETSTDGTGEPAQKIFEWLSQRGIGLAINPQKEFPDFILSYGMLWNFRNTGKFIVRNLPKDEGEFTFDPNEIKVAGTPDEKYMPMFARKILKEFFMNQGILNPRWALISLVENQFDLCFSLESLGNPPQTEHAGIAEAIGWFLPTHYPVMLVSEKGITAFAGF